MKRSLAPRVGFALAIVVMCALAFRDARAAVIAADGFDYKTPTIRGCNGGEGWADAWTGDNFISPGSLQFDGYATTGNRVTTLGDSASKSASVKCSLRTINISTWEELLIEGKFGRTNTTIWLSFLANMPEGANAKSGMFAGVSLMDDGKEKMFFGRCSSRNVWGFERSMQLQSPSTNRADATVVFLVYKMTFRPPGAQVEMWVNPKPGTNDLSTTPASAAQVREFRFNQARICSAPTTFGIDELRFGTTYADVAPAK